jgi:hypothetical protein
MPVDLYRDADQYILSADALGVDPGSVDVDVDEQLLTIRARRSFSSHEDAKWLAQDGSQVPQTMHLRIPQCNQFEYLGSRVLLACLSECVRGHGTG